MWFLAVSASALPGNWLEMQVLGPHVRPAELESLGVRFGNLYFDKLFWFLCTLKFEKHCLKL